MPSSQVWDVILSQLKGKQRQIWWYTQETSYNWRSTSRKRLGSHSIVKYVKAELAEARLNEPT